MNFILLEEWNKSALALIFLIFMIPVAIVYFLLYKLLRNVPRFKPVVDDLKTRNSFLYLLFVAGIMALSILITFGLLAFFFYKSS